MASLQPDTRSFFDALFPNDEILWPQIEYLIADFNSFLPHLFRYLVAKLFIAAKRNNVFDQFETIWLAVLDGFTMEDSEARNVALRVATEAHTLLLEDWETLRVWFRTRKHK
jgi:hypothetical protein